MRISAIIVDNTIVFDGAGVIGAVWPATLYGTPVQSIHAVQVYNTHTEVEYTNPAQQNIIFRDAIHEDNKAILAAVHAAALAGQPEPPPAADPAVMERLDKLMEAEREYSRINFEGHQFLATTHLYTQLFILKGLGRVYIIDADLNAIELTAAQRATLRDLIAPQIKILMNEYRKLLEL